MASCGLSGILKRCFYTGWTGEEVPEGEVPKVGVDHDGADGFITIDLTTDREESITACPAVKESFCPGYLNGVCEAFV
jgi:hypothetical protein